MDQSYIPDSPDSQLSDISFPSHVSGLESFNFDETTKGEEDSDNGSLDTKQRTLNGSKLNKRKSAVHSQEKSHSSLSLFLKVSSLPKSLSTSQFNTLNESSISIGNLEAIQAGNQDSFLNSHSEDVEKEKKLLEFLDEAKFTSERKEKDKFSLSDAIESTYQSNTNRKKEKSLTYFDSPEINQTEMDSLFLKEVRERLQMSKVDANDNSFIDTMTLKDLEENDDNLDISRAAIEELEKSFALALKQTNNQNNVYDRDRIESVLRPNLDGSSSGSDSDSVTSGASNFARSGLGTGLLAQQNERSNLQENNLHLTTIPERQIAEGSDMGQDIDGDGGGGGDGSSGSSDSDVGGGDGGVSMRGARLIVNTNFLRLDGESDDRITPPNRERPVGGSSSQERQVQFSTYIQMQQAATSNSSDSGVTYQSGSSDHKSKTQDLDGQDSRLSARFFLAASTPFKDQSATLNWLHQSSFHKSTAEPVQQDYTMDTPSSTVMGQLRQLHGEAPDWTFNSPTMTASKLQHTNILGLEKSENDQTITDKSQHQDSPNASKSLKYSTVKPYNPFESVQSKFLKNPFDTASENNNCFEQDLGSSFTSEEFHNNSQDLEKMLTEDERVIAQNNNSIYKESEKSEVEWSAYSGLLTSTSESNGRVSSYFKVKSNELGNLSNTEGPRPKFSDDSHIIKTPPSIDPLPLLKQNYSFDHDKSFSIERVTKLSQQSPNQEITESQFPSKCETPKSLHLTHKQTSDTVFKKCKQPTKMTPQLNLTKISDELQNKSFTIPKNHSEASNLFTDIQERRVSIIGLSNSQIIELANCIATMTGTNLSLVYKVLDLLSKEKKLSESVKKHNKFELKTDVAEKSRSQKKTPVSCSNSSINNNNDDASMKLSTVPLNDQHSSFYTPNISQNPADQKHNTVRLNEGGFHSTQLEMENVQNSLYKKNGLSNISPLVEVQNCYPKHVYTMQNSLPEFRLESKLGLVTRKNASLPEHLRLDELHSLHPREKMYEIQPLSTTKNTSQPEFYSKNTSTFGSSHGIWNHGGSTQSSMDIKRHHSVEYLKKQHLSESVIFPSEINFDVVCVGIAQSKVFQLHNSNNFWLQCQIHSIFVARNGREVEKSLEQPFIFPPKIQLEPHASEDLKVKFHAVHPGSYVMKIEILVAPLVVEQVPISWTRVGNIMDVVAVAEFPDIEVLLGEKKSIDFGLIGYGANTTQTLCILNKGRADVPIQLCIASGTSSKYFTFGMTKADNSLPNFLSILAAGQQRPGVALVPAVVTLRFTAPENSRQYLGCEEIACQIDVQTETDPVFPIASIAMKARVGKARLHSLKTLQVIEFSCNIGETAVRLIPLRNAGAILMDIEAKIVESCDEFSVTPISLQIKPEQELNLKVTFNPKKSSLVKGKLVVSLLPDGDQYEWSLHGKVISNSIISKNHAPALLCNKLAMNWSGVEVGQSRQQKLVLRNSSETQALNLSIAVADNPSSFQIQNSHEFEHKDLNRFEVVLKPQAEFPVYILFIPSKIAFASSSLVLRVINGSTKFLIPLSGYGGASNLEIKGAKSMNDKLFIDLGQVGYGKKAIVNIILRNNGSRAAFVSVDCYSDIASSSRYPESKIDISPNNFILKEYCSEQMTILFESIKEFQGSFAHLVIVSGDEILRQQYKKNRKRSNQKYFITPFKLELACLDKWFSGENDINSDLAYSGINDWENFFAANISTNVVSLVASSIQFEDSIVFNNKLQDGMLQFTPAQKLSLKKGNSNSKILDNKMMSWEVTPNEIILNASNNNSNVKLQLINYTDISLSFEFIWPAQTLIINPCKEKIPAKSSLGIKISVKPSFLSQPEDIPWFGSLYIQCNNEQKEVKVYIRNDVINELSPYTSNAEMNPLEVQDVSLIPHQHKSTNDIDPVVIISPCILEFKDTVVNMNDESIISVQSLFSKSCRWVLSSIAPPYFKSSNGRGEILRATYSAFRFAKHSGKLGEYQTMQLSVTFHPRALGIYSQFWDFEIMFEGNHPSKKHRLELVGKGMFSDAEIDVSAKKVGTAKPIPKNQAFVNTTDINDNIQEIITKPNPLAADDVSYQLPVISQSLPNEGSVFIKDENVIFNSVTVGEIAEQKFRLCNDSKEIQKVRVSGFQPPFSVIAKHLRLSIRPKSYIRVPVYFSPTSPKTSYEGVLIVSPERGDSLCVKLKGISL